LSIKATHDSIGLGEDGPTHQPVETVAHLRATPNLAVWRPADGNETSAAYLVALQSRRTPSVLCLSRQNLPQLENSTIEHAARGGYVIHEIAENKEDLTIVSTGSEVAIAVEAAGILQKDGYKVRVVSLPCWEIFDAQPKEYRLSILRSGAPVLSVEAYSVSLNLTLV
jgi:transketolase